MRPCCLVYLLTWPVHSLSAFAIVEEAGSEFAYLHAAPCTVRNFIFERTRHWTTAEGLVDQAFGGETSKGPTWCSNRRKNKTLTVKTNQFISKHKQIHNKNTNDNRQNQFPHIHLAGKLAFVANATHNPIGRYIEATYLHRRLRHELQLPLDDMTYFQVAGRHLGRCQLVKDRTVASRNQVEPNDLFGLNWCEWSTLLKWING